MHFLNKRRNQIHARLQVKATIWEPPGVDSPIGGYLEDRDLVFVLDVNSKFGPWLVPTERLYRAVNSPDSKTGTPRGLLLIQ